MSLTVKSLSIYPIKSCAGLDVSNFQIGNAGPQVQLGSHWVGDREWMFVDSEGKFLTQRSLQKMALLRPLLKDNRFFLQIEDQSYEIPLETQSELRKQVSVWGKLVDAALVDSPVSRAVSQYLGLVTELVHFDSQSHREILVKGRGQGAQTRFTDSQAYLVLTEESLKDLNSRLREPIGANRFRGNILLSGAPKAYAEDSWPELKSERLHFESTKPCGRCKIITVDPEQGQIFSSEPLQALSQFRRQESAVYFGQYFLSRSYGETLKVGDQLQYPE